MCALVAVFAVGAVFAAFTTLVAFATLTTFAAGTACGTLLPAFGLLFEYAVAEAELACLLVYFEELHADGVAFLDAGFFHCLKTLPGYLADVE